MKNLSLNKADIFFLLAAFVSFMFANMMYFGWGVTADREAGIFIGHWVSTILMALIFLKIYRRWGAT